MKIEILSELRVKKIIKAEMEKVRKNLYEDLNKMRERILQLEEDNKLLRKLLR